jgi:hypothetical protein
LKANPNPKGMGGGAFWEVTRIRVLAM